MTGIVAVELAVEKAMTSASRMPLSTCRGRHQEKKRIRAVGVSCHNLGAMKTAAKCPWVDVVLARINPEGTKMDGTVDEVVEVLREMKKNGKAVIGMKIYGEGKLAGMKEKCMYWMTILLAASAGVPNGGTMIIMKIVQAQISTIH